MRAVIDDTYAEAFRSVYVEFLITARDRRWVEHTVHAATGNGSSTIMCDCEAGVDRVTGSRRESNGSVARCGGFRRSAAS
jgi:formylmethanofuran--tetrahydromethanopterin N-formyltransferase